MPDSLVIILATLLSFATSYVFDVWEYHKKRLPVWKIAKKCWIPLLYTLVARTSVSTAIVLALPGNQQSNSAFIGFSTAFGTGVLIACGWRWSIAAVGQMLKKSQRISPAADLILEVDNHVWGKFIESLRVQESEILRSYTRGKRNQAKMIIAFEERKIPIVEKFIRLWRRNREKGNPRWLHLAELAGDNHPMRAEAFVNTYDFRTLDERFGEIETRLAAIQNGSTPTEEERPLAKIGSRLHAQSMLDPRTCPPNLTSWLSNPDIGRTTIRNRMKDGEYRKCDNVVLEILDQI